MSNSAEHREGEVIVALPPIHLRGNKNISAEPEAFIEGSSSFRNPLQGILSGTRAKIATSVLVAASYLLNNNVGSVEAKPRPAAMYKAPQSDNRLNQEQTEDQYRKKLAENLDTLVPQVKQSRISMPSSGNLDTTIVLKPAEADLKRQMDLGDFRDQLKEKYEMLVRSVVGKPGMAPQEAFDRVWKEYVTFICQRGKMPYITDIKKRHAKGKKEADVSPAQYDSEEQFLKSCGGDGSQACDISDNFILQRLFAFGAPVVESTIGMQNLLYGMDRPSRLEDSFALSAGDRDFMKKMIDRFGGTANVTPLTKERLAEVERAFNVDIKTLFTAQFAPRINFQSGTNVERKEEIVDGRQVVTITAGADGINGIKSVNLLGKSGIAVETKKGFEIGFTAPLGMQVALPEFKNTQIRLFVDFLTAEFGVNVEFNFRSFKKLFKKEEQEWMKVSGLGNLIDHLETENADDQKKLLSEIAKTKNMGAQSVQFALDLENMIRALEKMYNESHAGNRVSLTNEDIASFSRSLVPDYALQMADTAQENIIKNNPGWRLTGIVASFFFDLTPGVEQIFIREANNTAKNKTSSVTLGGGIKLSKLRTKLRARLDASDITKTESLALDRSNAELGSNQWQDLSEELRAKYVKSATFETSGNYVVEGGIVRTKEGKIIGRIQEASVKGGIVIKDNLPKIEPTTDFHQTLPPKKTEKQAHEDLYKEQVRKINVTMDWSEGPFIDASGKCVAKMKIPEGFDAPNKKVYIYGSGYNGIKPLDGKEREFMVTGEIGQIVEMGVVFDVPVDGATYHLYVMLLPRDANPKEYFEKYVTPNTTIQMEYKSGKWQRKGPLSLVSINDGRSENFIRETNKINLQPTKDQETKFPDLAVAAKQMIESTIPSEFAKPLDRYEAGKIEKEVNTYINASKNRLSDYADAFIWHMEFADPENDFDAGKTDWKAKQTDLINKLLADTKLFGKDKKIDDISDEQNTQLIFNIRAACFKQLNVKQNAARYPQIIRREAYNLLESVGMIGEKEGIKSKELAKSNKFKAATALVGYFLGKDVAEYQKKIREGADIEIPANSYMKIDAYRTLRKNQPASSRRFVSASALTETTIRNPVVLGEGGVLLDDNGDTGKKIGDVLFPNDATMAGEVNSLAAKLVEYAGSTKDVLPAPNSPAETTSNINFIQLQAFVAKLDSMRLADNQKINLNSQQTQFGTLKAYMKDGYLNGTSPIATLIRSVAAGKEKLHLSFDYTLNVSGFDKPVTVTLSRDIGVKMLGATQTPLNPPYLPGNVVTVGAFKKCNNLLFISRPALEDSYKFELAFKDEIKLGDTVREPAVKSSRTTAEVHSKKNLTMEQYHLVLALLATKTGCETTEFKFKEPVVK